MGSKFVTLISILVLLLPTLSMAKEFVVGDTHIVKVHCDYFLRKVAMMSIKTYSRLILLYT